MINVQASYIGSLFTFAKDIKVSHSIFALPFVATALLLAKVSVPEPIQLVIIVFCMVTARTFAMGMNRYFDADIDKLNVRTSVRAIPSGVLTRNTCLAISMVSGIIFVLGAFSLSPLAGKLAIPLLSVLCGYSLMKRWSMLTHWYLGMCLGLAPLAAEIALTAQISFPVIFLSLAIMFWTAGFDLIYSLQDRIFDIEHGLHSVPSRLGFRSAIYLSVLSFLMMILLLIVAGRMSNSGSLFYLGVMGVACLLIYEHWLVRDAWKDGVSVKLSAAFFNVNAFLSVFFFCMVFLDSQYHG